MRGHLPLGVCGIVTIPQVIAVRVVAVSACSRKVRDGGDFVATQVAGSSNHALCRGSETQDASQPIHILVGILIKLNHIGPVIILGLCAER